MGTVGDWLNRAGLIQQFIALFLLTPDILGKPRLRQLTDRYKAALKRHSWLGPTILIAILAPWNLLLNHEFPHPSLTEWVVGELVLLVLMGGVGLLLAAFAAMIGNDKASSYLGAGLLLFSSGFFCLLGATFVHS